MVPYFHSNVVAFASQVLQAQESEQSTKAAAQSNDDDDAGGFGVGLDPSTVQARACRFQRQFMALTQEGYTRRTTTHLYVDIYGIQYHPEDARRLWTSSYAKL